MARGACNDVVEPDRRTHRDHARAAGETGSALEQESFVKLYSSKGAPNPQRVTFFMAEKAITEVAIIEVNLMQGEHRTSEYLQKSPLAQSPALELDDGRVLTESRAICTYLEHVWPEPNLMGRDADERAFIEMWDRRIEFLWLAATAHWVRHGHPAVKVLEAEPLPALAAQSEQKMRSFARWLDAELAGRDFIAGDRFTIADITAFVTLGFARLMRYAPQDEGLANLVRWRDEIRRRPGVAS